VTRVVRAAAQAAVVCGLLMAAMLTFVPSASAMPVVVSGTAGNDIVEVLEEEPGSAEYRVTINGDITRRTIPAGSVLRFEMVGGNDRVTIAGDLRTGVSIGVQTEGDILLLAPSESILAASQVGGDYSIAGSGTGVLSDIGTISVAGELELSVIDVHLDQLDVTGEVVVNGRDVFLRSANDLLVVGSRVGGDSVIEADGAVVISGGFVGSVQLTSATGGVSGGPSEFLVGGDVSVSAVGPIELINLTTTGILTLDTRSDARIVSPEGNIVLAPSTVDGNLSLRALVGLLADTSDLMLDAGLIVIGGDLVAEALGDVTLDGLDLTGTADLTTFSSVRIANMGDLELLSVSADGTLEAGSASGDISGVGLVQSGGNATFNARAGAVSLATLKVAGALSVHAAAAVQLTSTADVVIRSVSAGGTVTMVVEGVIAEEVFDSEPKVVAEGDITLTAIGPGAGIGDNTDASRFLDVETPGTIAATANGSSDNVFIRQAAGYPGGAEPGIAPSLVPVEDPGATIRSMLRDLQLVLASLIVLVSLAVGFPAETASSSPRVD